MVTPIFERRSTFRMKESPLIGRGARLISFAKKPPPAGRIIDGEPWPPIFTPEGVRSAKALKPRPEDIFICTYPKCGTTWIQHIVHQLIGRTEYEQVRDNEGPGASENKSMCFVSPMIERMGADYCDTIRQPRVLKSHFTYDNIPKGGGAKYIFAVRNPKDCLTSYYHHHRNFKIYNFCNGDFDVFFDLFMSGNVGFGEYYKHLRSWLAGMERNDENILFLKYEDMVADLPRAIVSIGQFLGGEAAQKVTDQAILDQIVQNSSLAAMKRNQQRWFPNKQLNNGDFIRKGGSRDWKNHLTEEQNARMDERFEMMTRDTAAADWWREEMDWEEPQTSQKSEEQAGLCQDGSPSDSGYSSFPSSVSSDGPSAKHSLDSTGAVFDFS